LRVVGISGKARSGKDTVGQFLEKHGYERHAFADPLKEMCRRYFFLEGKDLTGDKEPWVREVLQLAGTEHGRDFWRGIYDRHQRQVEEWLYVHHGIKFCGDLWLAHMELTLQEVDSRPNPPKGVYIPDCRFENEANFVKGMGGVMVRVYRPKAGLEGEAGSHASETGLDYYGEWDYSIRNDGTLEDLERLVAYMEGSFSNPGRQECLHLRASDFAPTSPSKAPEAEAQKPRSIAGPVVYVAGPYRARDASGIHDNIQRARKVAIEVWQAGAVAVAPQLNSAFFDGLAPDEAWLDGYLELLTRCDAMVVVPGHENSKGTLAEIKLAEGRGMPLFYWRCNAGAFARFVENWKERHLG
jgi:hypothetical protein